MDVTFGDVYTSQKSVFGADFYTGWVSSSAHSGCRLQGQKNDWASIFGQMLVKAVEGRNQMLHVFGMVLNDQIIHTFIRINDHRCMHHTCIRIKDHMYGYMHHICVGHTA